MDFTPHTPAEIAEMLDVIGVSSISELFSAIPEKFLVKDRLEVPDGMTEAQVLTAMKAHANRNTAGEKPCFIGAGAYDHYVPSVVGHLISRGEFLTSYTPYQPELSQGTLQAQFEYQTMVAGLLGLSAANASMYEGATALAEACLMAQRKTRRTRILVSRFVHPQYRETLATYLGRDVIEELPWGPSGALDLAELEKALGPEVAAVVVQTPNFAGIVEDVKTVSDLAHSAGAMSIVTFTSALAFGLIEAPGVLGADIAAGEGQSLGLPLSFGGPYIGLFAVQQDIVKSMPGRLVGKTVDSRGSSCFVLTLAAREQHIRRERASSNICSNEGLCAVALAIHMSMLGKNGLEKLARYNHVRAEVLKARLAAVGIQTYFAGPTFNEFMVNLDKPVAQVIDNASKNGVLAGVNAGEYYPELGQGLLVAVTESRSNEDFERLVTVLT